MPFIPALGVGVLGALGTMGPVTLGAATTAGVATLGLGAAGIGAAGYGIYSAMNQKKDEPSIQNPMAGQTALPPAPKPEEAIVKAREEMEQKKRMRLLSGGDTLLVGNKLEKGNPNAPKTLLGS